jgi:hypothetical protein
MFDEFFIDADIFDIHHGYDASVTIGAVFDNAYILSPDQAGGELPGFVSEILAPFWRIDSVEPYLVGLVVFKDRKRVAIRHFDQFACQMGVGATLDDAGDDQKKRYQQDFVAHLQFPDKSVQRQ